MKLSEFKKHLSTVQSLNFVHPNGYNIARHFHITEIGLISKQFIDCGGAVHSEKMANIQIWVALDVDHRLTPYGLLNILDISQKILKNEDLDIEVEYQTETIGKYGLYFSADNFHLTNTQTDCLAKDKCGIPIEKPKKQLVELGSNNLGSCTPGENCC